MLNNTKVIPANLLGAKEKGGAKVEVLLVRNQKPETRNQEWLCLVKPGKRLKVGSRIIFGEGELIGTVLEKLETGEQIIEFKGNLWDYMQRNGEVPLPPYIKPSKPNLHRRYQTVYANAPGASAAPTAGLHFTEDLLGKIEALGIGIAYVTLHTGLATFLPVRTENVEEHKMYSEYFEVPEETIEGVKKAKRVIAVGTTTVRALESINKIATKALKHEGNTNLFIYPGYRFKVVDAVITNFHWPRSTLIMLVSAFAGKDFVMKAYREAIRERYRFFSFGDAMLIL